MINIFEQVLVLITIVGNFLLPYLPNHTSIVDINNKYLEKTLFNPAPWIFAIWGFIYVGLLIGFTLQKTEYCKKSQLLFLIASISNLAWIYFWTLDQIASAYLMFIPLIFSLLTIFVINLGIDIFLQNTIATYLSWAIIASCLNLYAVLLNSSIPGSNLIITTILCLSQLLWINFNNKYFYSNSITYPLVGITSGVALISNKGFTAEFIVYLVCCVYNLFRYWLH